MLKINLLNVGKGNCVIIEHQTNRISIIDIDNSHIDDNNDILTEPIDFIKKYYKNKDIFRFILTHPDMDHMSGLDELIKLKKIYNFWDTKHNKIIDVDSDDFGPYNKQDWLTYQEIRKGNFDITLIYALRDAVSDCCWIKDNIKILSPSQKLINLANEKEEYNHISYVLRLEYKNIVILLGGDASKESWDDIYKHYKNKNQLGILKSDAFLAPHHGSPNNVNKDVFKSIDPDYVIISDQRGTNYDDYYKSLAKKELYTTKSNGNIYIEISETGKGLIKTDK